MEFKDFNFIEAKNILNSAGIANPDRVVKLISKTLHLLDIDLTDLTVLTEAASGPYVVTPIIASLAGAKHVYALTRDSQFATIQQVIDQTRALETLCGVQNKIEIMTERHPDLFSQADIVTNLGFVRPIDESLIQIMKPECVIPLMFESWEFRSSDLDLEACHRYGITVAGTNEDYSTVNVFNYSGFLCMKMLFDSGIEIHKSKILIIGNDKFNPTITQYLKRVCGYIYSAPNLKNIDRNLLTQLDALIVADFQRETQIIGNEGDISPTDLAQCAPGLAIIQFAGQIDVTSLQKEGFFVFPGKTLEAHRMSQTLAGIGIRPVIELHSAGLKVGQLLSNARRQGLTPEQAVKYAIQNGPAQVL